MINKNELIIVKYILEQILSKDYSNIPNEDKLVFNESNNSISLNNNLINNNSSANTSCFFCSKHMDNTNINKCEKCLESVCEECKFLCKSTESEHKNVFCKNCFVKCHLCANHNFCIKCSKSCKGKKCSVTLCPTCYKPNKHLFYENCKSIDCRECDNKNICILTTFYCSNCNERFCYGCSAKSHQHKIINKTHLI